MTRLTIKVVPTSGSRNEKEIEIPATGTSVKEALAAAGLSSEGFNVSVDNEPALLNTHVPAGATVTLTEKAKGS